MIFKVGDKVKIIDSPKGCWNGKICKVIKILSRLPGEYNYRIQEVSNTDWDCPMLERELESIVKKGQQLVFSFMDSKI